MKSMLSKVLFFIMNNGFLLMVDLVVMKLQSVDCYLYLF